VHEPSRAHDQYKHYERRDRAYSSSSMSARFHGHLFFRGPKLCTSLHGHMISISIMKEETERTVVVVCRHVFMVTSFSGDLNCARAFTGT
jgi:hypothetical protein